MKPVLFSALLFLLFACRETSDRSSAGDPFAAGRWIDLTHPFSDSTLYWPNNPSGFKLDTQANGQTPQGYFYSSNAFSAPEHGGTHLDAPVHFARGKQSVSEIPLRNLTGNAAVIDVSEDAGKNRDYLITIQDVENWEKENGAIPQESIVLFRTGYGRFYPDAKQVFGTDEKSAAAIPHLHFPGIDPQTAGWLYNRRKVKAVGIDTPSIDYGQSSDFKTHRMLLGNNVPAFENVANLEQLPAKGSYVVALPMKIKNGSGGPLHIVAWVKESR